MSADSSPPPAPVRVSSADLSPLQIAESQAGRLGRWICEDALGFVEFPSQEEADDALLAAVWADRTEVTDAQADAAFRYAERHSPTEEDRASLARITARVLSSPPPAPSPATTPLPRYWCAKCPATFGDFASCDAHCHTHDAATTETTDVERDAARYRWLRDTFHAAKGSAHLTVNGHLAYYEPSEPGKEVQVQWYPDTPIGSYSVYGATMDEAIDAARNPGDSR